MTVVSFLSYLKKFSEIIYGKFPHFCFKVYIVVMKKYIFKCFKAVLVEEKVCSCEQNYGTQEEIIAIVCD